MSERLNPKFIFFKHGKKTARRFMRHRARLTIKLNKYFTLYNIQHLFGIAFSHVNSQLMCTDNRHNLSYCIVLRNRF